MGSAYPRTAWCAGPGRVLLCLDIGERIAGMVRVELLGPQLRNGGIGVVSGSGTHIR